LHGRRGSRRERWDAERALVARGEGDRGDERVVAAGAGFDFDLSRVDRNGCAVELRLEWIAAAPDREVARTPAAAD
jgi:hypothetical protein